MHTTQGLFPFHDHPPPSRDLETRDGLGAPVCFLLRSFSCVATVTLRNSFPREDIYNKPFASVAWSVPKSCNVRLALE